MIVLDVWICLETIINCFIIKLKIVMNMLFDKSLYFKILVQLLYSQYHRFIYRFLGKPPNGFEIIHQVNCFSG